MAVFAEKIYVDDFFQYSATVDARTAAMGGAGLAVCNNAAAVLHNPGLMRNLEVPTVTAGHTGLLFGTKEHSVSFVKPAAKTSFGLTYILQNFSSHYFVSRDEFGTEQGTFSPQYQVLAGALAKRMFRKRILLGFNIKYITKSISQKNKNTVDAGVSYTGTLKRTFNCAVMLDNIFQSQLAGYTLPVRIKAAVARTWFRQRLLSTVQLNTAGSRVDYHLGGAYRLFDNFILLAGMEKDRFSIGGEFRYADYTFNYVFKKIDTAFSNDGLVSTIGISWAIGRGRLYRLREYNIWLAKGRDSLKQELYQQAISQFTVARNFLHKRRDKQEYKDIEFYIRNTEQLYADMENEKKNRTERYKAIMAKARRLIGQREFKIAIEELRKIDDDSEYYTEARDLLEKVRNEYEKERRRLEEEREFIRLKDEYDWARDIHFKIKVGEMLLRIKEDKQIKNEVQQLRELAAQRKTSLRKTTLVQRNLELMEKRTKQNQARERYEQALKLMEKGYLELAQDELKAGQKLLNDYTWHEKLISELDVKISRKLEEESRRKVINQLYHNGFKLFVSGSYSSANAILQKILTMAPDHTEARGLVKRIKELQKTKNITIKKVEKTMSVEELKYMRAKIQRLFNESISLYTDEKMELARAKLQEILTIDPDYEKAKKYLELMK